MGSTLAFRRSIQRLKSFPDNPLQLPRPINTSGATSSPITSFDTSILSDESSLFNLQQQPSHELNNIKPVPNKLKKKSRSPRKWNFFSRSNTQPKPEKTSETVTVTVQPVEKKPVAFYTIMDSPEQELAEPVDLKEILREADAYARSPAKISTPELQATEGHPPNMSHLQPPANIVPQYPLPGQDLYAMVSEPAFPRMEGVAPVAVTLSSGRPSRLPQVGRIPQVVSHRASPRSFSRPFGTNQPLALHIPPTRGIGMNTRVPNFSKPATPIPDASGEGSTTDAGTEFSFFSEPRSHRSPELPATQEFLAFSPRKNSDCTSSTESCVYSYVEATAVIPKPDDPPVEDEVWDEYDDLLVEDAVKDRQSTTSSKGIPFHLETYQMRLAKEKSLESPTIVTDSRKLSTLSDAPTASTTFSADMTERIRKAFQPHPSPTVPSPVPEDVEQNNGGHSRKPSAAETMRHSTVSSHKSRQSGSSSSSEEGTPLAQVNLRVGSMTVSKWLTFGQVLFSDIRHGLVRGQESLERPSVLVIDGLGNDDWSFYAAETYSAASFFNLSPRAPLPVEVQTSPARYPLSPPNHHQVQYLSHLEKFPFDPQTFNCVVYRFPVAASEAHYQNVLTEARRVLKPGGYLELSILDVDLNNMGNRGRRTIRQLKERINETSSETNLSSTADLIVRLLGKSGFSTIKAARVGVPVASSITSSDDNVQGKSSAENKKKKPKDQPSLAEMMRDLSPNADEGITNMVSRVGRWWYSRCYENSANHPSEKSIWNDKALLRECEELGTSLKLMVCCARAL
jgi:ubiquinone/menaquinone biosynthesis C-methylase UbiE